MESLIIESTKKYIPNVSFNAVSGVLTMEGQCYMEHTENFFNPILEWLDNYLSVSKGSIEMNVRLTYFNTSAVKCIYEILNKLETYYTETKSNVMVKWYFHQEDDSLLDIYQDFKDEVKLPFQHIEIEEDY